MGRERPHSTGVESTTHTSSVHNVVSMANTRIIVVMSVGVADPAGLGGETEQCLHHCQGDQFGIGQPRLQTDRRAPRRPFGVLAQQVIGPDVQCGGEGVQVVVTQ
ncbi:hypothetical protein GCM10012275_56620 [Longimycelium tulufanense]|uniref:Uncharacterized protein n=1 Tax=Longimycelium tulufanense TaxID=907463 RepID=A0A8J3CJK9_9PSEU|nr:hypothetical protein [Longimycelium tulufanense]GGM78678.1 hypothetical protein GCM10012275_56620 [Longimycelium tulufanense]